MQNLESEPWKTIHPTRINCGPCGLFAIDVLRSLRHRGSRLREIDNDDRRMESLRPKILFGEELFPKAPSHVWLFCDGRHFDAESPWGTEDPRDLPFFSRFLRRFPNHSLNRMRCSTIDRRVAEIPAFCLTPASARALMR